MKRYIRSGQLVTRWRMVGEYDDGSTREVSGNSEEECVEKLYNMGGKYGGLLVDYYGVNDDNYVDGEYRWIDASVTASVDQRQPWKVTVTVDNGGPESGPMIDGYDMLVWARSKQEAEQSVLDEFDDAATADGVYAEPADPAYVELATREAENEQWIDEQEAWNAGMMDYAFEPDDEEQHEWESQYHSWQQVYDEMKDMEDAEAYEFFRRATHNPYFHRAWIEYNK